MSGERGPRVLDSNSESEPEEEGQCEEEENKDQSKKMVEVLQSLDELDDVQEIFTNANLEI